MFEFCICNGDDTEFCPFHDPKNIERKKMSDAIPSAEQSKAADWLSKQDAYEQLPLVAKNGATALFWYVASLLVDYKKTPE